MPLFQCTQCGAIENTALGEWWGRTQRDRARCSECATGTWHMRFEKRNAFVMGYLTDGRFIYSPQEVTWRGGLSGLRLVPQIPPLDKAVSLC